MKARSPESDTEWVNLVKIGQLCTSPSASNEVSEQSGGEGQEPTRFTRAPIFGGHHEVIKISVSAAWM